MPELPSGLNLAISRDALFDHGGNWFRCPDGHFWYWIPAPEMGAPPYDLNAEIDNVRRIAQHAPVPESREEAKQFIAVLEINDNGLYSSRGEWLSSFPRYTKLDEPDLAAWNAWVNRPETNQFLEDTIAECQRLAEVSRHARGYATLEGVQEPEENGEWSKGYLRRGNPMSVISQEDPPEPFIQAWGAARDHINRLLPSLPDGAWLRNNIFKPFSEHLSFRLGNQIFMVYVDPYIDGQSIYPCSGNRRHLFRQIIDDANAFGCILRMYITGEEFKPFFPNSGMIDISTDRPIEPSEKITDELIEMTEWELLDSGIQVVRNGLAEDGKEITSWQSSLRIDPSIWFRDADGDHWVVVRIARYPERHAPVPQHIDAIRKSCATISDSGFFASVIVASADDEFRGQNVRPLYRGQELAARKDLEAV